MNSITAYNLCKRCGTKASMPGYTLCKNCLKENEQDLSATPLYDWEGQRFETNQEPGRTASLQQKILRLAVRLNAASQYEAAKEMIFQIVGAIQDTPESLGFKFNAMEFSEFVSYLRQKIKENPSTHFVIVADWVNVHKIQAAKALLDGYRTRLNIDSIAIKATRQQYNEDVNAFQSGVKWIEI